MESYGDWIHRGVSLFNQNRFDEAVLSYRRAIALEPNRFEAYNNLGNALFHLKRFQEAEESLRKAVALNPKSAPAWDNLGALLVNQGKFDNAISCYKTAIRLGPVSDTYLGLGNAYSGKNLSLDAIREFEMAISLNGKSRKAHYNLGRAHFLQKRYDDALRHFQNALSVDAGESGIYIGIGAAYAKKGDHSSAQKFYEKAIQIDPHSALARYNLARLLWKFGDLEQAKSQLRESIALDKTLKASYISLANILMEQGRADEAVTILERALKIYPNEAVIYNNLGNSYFSLNRYEDAKKSFEKAVELKQDYTVAHYNLANFTVGYSLHSLKNAIGHFEKALEGQKFIPAIENNIGFTYAKLGELEKAKEHYEAALKSDPKYKTAMDNLSIVEATAQKASPDVQIIVCYLLAATWGLLTVLLYLKRLSGGAHATATIVMLGLIVFVALNLKRIKVQGLELERSDPKTISDQVEYDFFASEVKLVPLEGE